MQLHTPAGVRLGALALAAASAIAGNIALATPASAATLATTAVTASAPTTHASYAYLVTRQSNVARGTKVALTGKVSYDTTRLTGQLTVLQEDRGGTWRTIAYPLLSSTGYASATVRPAKTTRYRLAFRGATGWAPSISEPLLVKVRGLTAAQKSAQRAATVLRAAKAKTGHWYRWGAAGPTYFDCSGLTWYAYRMVGVKLPHQANAQKRYGKPISRAKARPGDLIIFLRGGYGYHAAIYAGGNYMYDAPHPGARVGKHKIWSSHIIFRRLV